jgi:hypothetical protein
MESNGHRAFPTNVTKPSHDAAAISPGRYAPLNWLGFSYPTGVPHRIKDLGLTPRTNFIIRQRGHDIDAIAGLADR